MRCGAPLQQTATADPAAPAAAPPPVYSGQPVQAGEQALASPLADYAGFWLRFLAYMIDSIVMSIVLFMVLIPIAIVFGVAAAATDGDLNLSLEGLEAPLMGLYYAGTISMQWLYEALLTASSRQGTLGKMALGLIVTDLEGNRISFGRATGRFFSKLVSGLILMIGFFMQPFTNNKQALHDMMAGTLVVHKPSR